LDYILPAQKTDRQGYSPPISKPIIPSASSNELSIGHQVEHKLFGKGKILAVEGTGETAKLTIIFSGNVRKKLIAKYANLKLLKASSY
jgi:hypothetical protein